MAEGAAEKGGPVALELIGWGADSGGPRRDGLGLFSIDVIHHEAKLDRGAPRGPREICYRLDTRLPASAGRP